MDTPLNIDHLADRQREFFLSGATVDLDFRFGQLSKLRRTLKTHTEAIVEALAKDLGKPMQEAFSAEIAVVLEEIRYAIRHLRQWNKPQRVRIPFYLFGSKGILLFEPLGVALIIGPWNFPFHLTLMPLVGALSAGNCVVVKPSELAPHSSKILCQMIQTEFDNRTIAVVEGGAEVSQTLLGQKWDHIFFTGSPRVGKIVMQHAATHLTPVTLELGGKNPTVIDKTADLENAARRIAFGKFFNAGQSCVAPDYAFVHADVKEAFVKAMKETITKFYSSSPLQCPDLARIVNIDHFHRLERLLREGPILTGGEVDIDRLVIAPTLIDNPDPNSSIMQEEIFGPLLPIFSYRAVDEVISFVQRRPKPLAFYLFTSDRRIKRRLLRSLSFGGGCINDSMIHFSVNNIPFGGVGTSGIGAYHGKNSFATFSHVKGIIERPRRLDMTRFFRFPPYSNKKLGLLRWYFR